MEKKRIPSTDPSTWKGSFKIGDKVRIRIDFKEWLGKKNDTETIFVIVSLRINRFKGVENPDEFPENPSGTIYKLSNGNYWEGKDLELASEDVSMAKQETAEPQTQKKVTALKKPNVTKINFNIDEKIKDLGLVPLFPDYYYFNSSKKNPNDRLVINSDDYYDFRQTMYFERPSIDKSLKIQLLIDKDFSNEMHFDIIDSGGVSVYVEDFDYLKFDNLPDVLNLFNEKYEIVAKVFNEMLLEKLKEDLEEEKSKGEESEEGKQKGKPKEMTAEDIEKLLEELKKEQKGQSNNGQSDNTENEIDLEDFLDKVEKGEADNDFTKNYNNKDLKDKIDEEKRERLIDDGGFPLPDFDDNDFPLPDFPEQPSNSENKIEGVLEAIIDLLNTDKQDIKRQFPTEKSAKSFVSLLSPNELDFIIAQVGLPNTLSRFEKQKLITSNFITELENI